MLADHMLVQTVVVARCDIPRAPMPKHPIKLCHLKKGILRTDRSPFTPSGSEISGPTQHRCLLLVPPASSIDVITGTHPYCCPSSRQASLRWRRWRRRRQRRRGGNTTTNHRRRSAAAAVAVAATTMTAAHHRLLHRCRHGQRRRRGPPLRKRRRRRW